MNKRRGYSLLEIIVAIAVIALVATALTVGLNIHSQGNRINRQKVTATQIAKKMIEDVKIAVKVNDVSNYSCATPTVTSETVNSFVFTKTLTVRPNIVSTTDAGFIDACNTGLPDGYRVIATVTWETADGTQTQTIDTQISNERDVTPVLTYVRVEPSSIILGEDATLSYDITRGTPPITYEINQGIGTRTNTNPITVSPTSTTTYTVTATNNAGSDTQSATLVVNIPPSINTLTASPALITAGSSSTLSWTVSGTGPITLSFNQGIGTVTGNSRTVSPEYATTYTLTATSPYGTDTRTVTVQTRPTASITVSPDTIRVGNSATLSWTVRGASSASISPTVGTVTNSGSGSRSVSPTASTTYTLTATSPGGTATDTVTLYAGNPPTASFGSSPTSIIQGNQSTLNWNVAGADWQNINQGIGGVGASGSRNVWPGSTTTYTLTAGNRYGDITDTTTVRVNPPIDPPPPNPGGPPTITFVAEPAHIGLGTSSSLIWSVNGATSISIDQGIGSVGANGSRVYQGTTVGVRTFTLTASNANGTSTARASITVMNIVGWPCIEKYRIEPNVVSVGQPVTLSWEITDSTTNSLAYTSAAGARNISVGNVATMTFTPQAGDAGRVINFTLTASNARGSDAKTIPLTVLSNTTLDFVVETVSVSGGSFGNLGIAPAIQKRVQPGSVSGANGTLTIETSIVAGGAYNWTPENPATATQNEINSQTVFIGMNTPTTMIISYNPYPDQFCVRMKDSSNVWVTRCTPF